MTKLGLINIIVLAEMKITTGNKYMYLSLRYLLVNKAVDNKLPPFYIFMIRFSIECV